MQMSVKTKDKDLRDFFMGNDVLCRDAKIIYDRYFSGENGIRLGGRAKMVSCNDDTICADVACLLCSQAMRTTHASTAHSLPYNSHILCRHPPFNESHLS